MKWSDITMLQSISGAKAKQAFLAEHSEDEEFRKVLYYALNPLLTYNLSEDTLRKRVPGAWSVTNYKDIFEICAMLSARKGVDDVTISSVCSFIRTKPDEEQEIYIKLLSKTLRLGVTAKTVNKIIPELIPEWEVQQAYPIDKFPLKHGTEFWVTQKLNGVRATYFDGKLIARSGVPFQGLNHIINSIEAIPDANRYVLDGELTLKCKGQFSDNEAFRVATGILNSDNVNKTEICFTVFDAIPVGDFISKTPSCVYSERRSILETFKPYQTDCLNVLPVLYHGTALSKIDELLDQMVKEDKEGLMVNTEVPYQRTRHRGILKVKRFYTMDLPIIGCEEGTGRLEGTLGAMVLQYKDNEVKVGSGFTDEQRTEYWKNKDSLIGTLCEVKYKEISSDKNTGLESLQFPVFVQLRADKSEVSYG